MQNSHSKNNTSTIENKGFVDKQLRGSHARQRMDNVNEWAGMSANEMWRELHDQASGRNRVSMLPQHNCYIQHTKCYDKTFVYDYLKKTLHPFVLPMALHVTVLSIMLPELHMHARFPQVE